MKATATTATPRAVGANAASCMLAPVGPEAWLGLAAAALATPLDAWMLSRVVRAYVKARRTPHLFLALGIVGSYVTGLAGCVVVGTTGDLSSIPPAVAALCRGTMFVGAGVSYGLVAPFAASVFHGGSRAFAALAAAMLVLETGLGIVALAIEPASVVTPATMALGLRVPFVALASGSLGWVAWRALRGAARMERSVKDAAGRVGLAHQRRQSAGLWQRRLSR